MPQVMSEWYYARGGQQSGPVAFEQLVELARNGGLDPAKDLVWTSTMKDWVPAGKVEGLFAAAPASPDLPASDPANPYSAPQSTWVAPAPSPGIGLPEIIHGSEPIDLGGCIKRGFELTKRQFGIILLVGLVYIGVSIGASVVLGLVDAALGWGTQTVSYNFPENSSSPGGVYYQFMANQQSGSIPNMILSQVLSTFLSLGAARIGLNLVSGKEVAVGMLFCEGRKLLRAIGASILFGLAVAIGILLLIVPGIYIALRYGQYMVAIVDRDLGIFESFSYSSALTTNNRLLLLGLWVLSALIVLAGLIACGVGLIFAIPMVWLTSMVAYRWMQYGHRAAMDHPGTLTPMLTGV
jgi:hypothetical protein